MKITCVSDLHGETPQLDGGDLLIVAGDLTDNDSVDSHCEFRDWLKNQTYSKKIVVAGNHDGHLQKMGKIAAEVLFKECGAIYLEDSGTEYRGFKIWGSPWTATFGNWHFMLPRGKEITAKWNLIPFDIDILVTHSPPRGILDIVKRKLGNGSFEMSYRGCYDLNKAIKEINPKLHVFGHIHEGYGQRKIGKTLFVNASMMNDVYDPVNKPVYIEL